MVDLSMQTETTIDVAEIVSDDQVKFFVDNGYLVVNNLIDSEEIQELRDDLIDIAMAISTGKKTKGGRVGILTSTGGAGSLVADRCGLVGLTTPAPSRKTAALLGSLLRHVGFIANRNPIDLTLAGLTPEIVRGSITALIEAKEYDIVIPIIGSSSGSRRLSIL